MVKKYQETGQPETVVEAAKFDGTADYWDMCLAWPGFVSKMFAVDKPQLSVSTIKNNSVISLTVHQGEYVIRHADGGYEKLTEEEFNAKYEPAK